MTYDANCAFVAGETVSDIVSGEFPGCPHCKAVYVETQVVDVSTHETPNLFHCLDCETVWTETYGEGRDAPHLDMG